MEIIEKSINYLKSLTAETISHAKSGHTGSALGASSILFALFKDHLKFDASDKKWLGRDRFVMSAGHASGLLYSLLYMFGFDITIEDLKSFRCYGSKTPGHPEVKHVPGVETTTGPLGQGVANAVGMAIAEAMLSARFGGKEKIIDNYTYCYAGDGCLMEGVGVEACSLAGTLKLNKLILLYDNNDITIDGNVNIANRENVADKFKAMGWNVLHVKNGNDYFSCTKAIAKAKCSDKPTIIIFKTIIGIGTKKQGTCSVHAYPLPEDELAEFKTSINASESFYVPDDVLDFCRKTTDKNNKLIESWNNNINSLKIQNSAKYKDFMQFFSEKTINYAKILENLNKQNELAGRDISNFVLNEISKEIPNMIGGTADLAPSTKAYIKEGGDFSAENRLGRNIHFGIREHSMGSIANGIALYFDLFVFDSTFLAFSNYMLPAIKMRGLMDIPVLSVFTHDSIDVGEDGITHQPIEQIGQLRLTPNITVIRPGTKAEVVAAYKFFLSTRHPVSLILTKSTLKDFSNSKIEDAERGAYILFETKLKPTVEIFATGKELALAVNIASELEKLGTGSRVISMPCESIFDSQDSKYKKSLRLKTPALKVAIEASNDNMWWKYIGSDGLNINVTKYQTSGKGSEVYSKAGFNTESILKQIKSRLKIK